MAYYPTKTKEYVTKIDKNASGWYVPNIDGGGAKTKEFFNVPAASPYQLYLDHVPTNTKTMVVGASGGTWPNPTVTAWTEETSAPSAANRYYIDYSTGKVTFHSANANATVGAQYYCLGDDIMASHVNDLQEEVTAVENELGVNVKGSYSNVNDRLNAITTSVTASGINGDSITDGTVRAGALMDDIKGTTWGNTRDKLTDISTHIADPLAAHADSAISVTSPGSTTFTSVEGHILSGGVGTFTDINPHGLTLVDIVGTTTDIDIQAGIKAVNIEGTYIAASGNVISINSDGSDANQYLTFYENSTNASRHLAWDDTNGKFTMNDSLELGGNLEVDAITASGSITVSSSGNVVPNASGTREVGTDVTPFASGHFGTVRTDTLYATDAYIDADTLYIGPEPISLKGSDLNFGDIYVSTISASGNLVPDASGSRYVGTQTLSWGAANIDAIRANDTIEVKSAYFNIEGDSSSGGVVNLDWTKGNKHKIVLTENITDINFTDPAGTTNLILIMEQDSTGSRTATGWDTNVKWVGGVAPTLSTGVNDIDIVSFLYDSSGDDYYGTISQDFS